jgi:MoxR-like ATPase
VSSSIRLVADGCIALGPTSGAHIEGEGEAMDSGAAPLGSPDALQEALAREGYLAGRGLAHVLFLAARLPRPLLLEGESGVGKTEAAKAMARAMDTPFFRLQCYEGIDVSAAIYEWDYPRQLLSIRRSEASAGVDDETSLFGSHFLIRRPALSALEYAGPAPAVLLIDEVDRSDEQFEAVLFQLLGEFAVTIPELGTISAVNPPVVILTSNRSRDLHDALKRRCLYHWIDHPTLAETIKIVRSHFPATHSRLSEQVSQAVHRLRSLDLEKPPGLAEAIDWVQAVSLTGTRELTKQSVEATLSTAIKSRNDYEVARCRAEWLMVTGSDTEKSDRR